MFTDSRTATLEMTGLRLRSSMDEDAPAVFVPLEHSSTTTTKRDFSSILEENYEEEEDAVTKRARSATPPTPMPAPEDTEMPPLSLDGAPPAFTKMEVSVLPATQLAVARLEATGATDKPTDYFATVDMSGSMNSAGRRDAVCAALKAQLEVLVRRKEILGLATEGDVRFTVIAFDDRARVAWGPGTPQEALADMARIESRLRAEGGTSIEEALTLTMRLANQSTETGRNAVVLLLTDGEDPSTARDVASFVDNTRPHEWLRPLGGVGGIEWHFVAICAAADSALLGRLAELTHGTFSSATPENVKPLMGSLVGLVMETMEPLALLTIRGEDGAVMLEQRVRIRVGTPALVPFELSSAAAFTMEVRYPRLGAPIGTSPVLVASQQGAALTEEEESKKDALAVLHARRWAGVANASAAASLLRHHYEEAILTLDTAMASIEELRQSLAANSTPALDELLSELREERTRMESALHDRQELREMVARAESRASTARNGNLSISDARNESATQATMRTASMTY